MWWGPPVPWHKRGSDATMTALMHKNESVTFRAIFWCRCLLQSCCGVPEMPQPAQEACCSFGLGLQQMRSSHHSAAAAAACSWTAAYEPHREQTRSMQQRRRSRPISGCASSRVQAMAPTATPPHREEAVARGATAAPAPALGRMQRRAATGAVAGGGSPAMRQRRPRTLQR